MSQLVGLFREAISEIVGLVIVEAMARHEIGEIGAIDLAGGALP
nr:hypothetical protein [Microvirga sp. VF16]